MSNKRHFPSILMSVTFIILINLSLQCEMPLKTPAKVATKVLMKTPTNTPLPKAYQLTVTAMTAASVQLTEDANHLAQTTQAVPKPVGTVRPTDVKMFMFAEADCPKDLFPVLKYFSFGPGALDCQYHFPGTNGVANNMEIRIFQYPDPQKFQQIISGDMATQQKIIANVKNDAAAGRHKNEALDVIKDSPTESIYMHTYDETYLQDANTLTQSCGEGGGVLSFDGIFVVSLRFSSCSFYTSPGDYSRGILSMRDAAETAIADAEANKKR